MNGYLKQQLKTILHMYFNGLIKKEEAIDSIELTFNTSKYFHVDSFFKGIYLGVFLAATYNYFCK